MEKEDNQNINTNPIKSGTSTENKENLDKEKENLENNQKTPEEKIIELEDKLARTFAEMENQRRRFEKEKEDAFEYGGFALAKEGTQRY